MNFFGVLLIILVTLKVLGLITLSWIWVLAPLWLPSLIVVVVLGLMGLAVYGEKRGWL